jgi:hypothetical protein
LRWWDTTVSPILDEGRVIRVLATSRDVTGEMRAEAHRQLLVNELNHRVKNTLATIQSIASQSLRNAGVDLAVRGAFEGRLMAIAATHNVLTDENWSAASLRQIIDGSVMPYRANPGATDHQRRRPDGLAQAGGGAGPGLPRTGDQRPEVRRAVGRRRPCRHRLVGGERRPAGHRLDRARRPRRSGARAAGVRLADRRAGPAQRTGRPGGRRLSPEGLRCRIRAPLAALDKVDAFMPLPFARPARSMS